MRDKYLSLFLCVFLSATIVLPKTRPNQKKIRIRGFVDRISNDIVVVVIKNPKFLKSIKELYIPTRRFPKHIPQEGEYVSIIIYN